MREELPGSGARPPLADRLPADVVAARPTVWVNPSLASVDAVWPTLDLGEADIEDARRRWDRFAPLLAVLFPELVGSGGHIDSPLLPIEDDLAETLFGDPEARFFVKADHALPLTGSIKARGGVYEVLWFAEKVALERGLLGSDGGATGYEVLASEAARAVLAHYTILVGSTGNLGFSVGLMARALGFRAEVHMSIDAKAWKKDRLRRIGATVVEHRADYTTAVAEARAASAGRDDCHFVDDEDSVRLFLGYAAAARDVAAHLREAGVEVSAERPLVVYLPCGVGGAPGGIAFGLKHVYGDAVRCVFVEPVQAPCLLVQLASGSPEPTSIYDVGLTNRTEADGLAVQTASPLVVRLVGRLIDGVVTVADADLLAWVRRMWESRGLRLEPSAAAAFAAVVPWRAARANGPSATHLVWTTGGAMLPDEVFEDLLARA